MRILHVYGTEVALMRAKRRMLFSNTAVIFHAANEIRFPEMVVEMRVVMTRQDCDRVQGSTYDLVIFDDSVPPNVIPDVCKALYLRVRP